jgi:hypothetical protein
MTFGRKHKLIAGAAALVAAAGGGVAIAASGDNSRSVESQAVIDDAAKQLGIPSEKLSAALKKALSDRVEAAVAAGRITKAEGDAIKQRIQSDDFPLFGGGLHRGFGHLAGFDAAAAYVGVTEAQLRTELEGDKSLAQVARDHGKSVDGLVAALVKAAKERLDRAVAAGRLTKAQEDEMLSGLEDRIANMVNSTGLGRPPFAHPSFGLRHFRGPFS